MKLSDRLRETAVALRKANLERDALMEWVLKHGRHSSDCYSLRNFERDCDCGLYDIRQRATDSQSDAAGVK